MEGSSLVQHRLREACAKLLVGILGFELLFVLIGFLSLRAETGIGKYLEAVLLFSIIGVVIGIILGRYGSNRIQKRQEFQESFLIKIDSKAIDLGIFVFIFFWLGAVFLFPKICLSLLQDSRGLLGLHPSKGCFALSQFIGSFWAGIGWGSLSWVLRWAWRVEKTFKSILLLEIQRTKHMSLGDLFVIVFFLGIFVFVIYQLLTM